jgi:hypothetical protein
MTAAAIRADRQAGLVVQSTVRMVPNPRKETVIEPFEKHYVLPVVRLHPLPSVCIPLHARGPQLLALMLGLGPDVQDLRDVIEFVRGELERATSDKVEVDLLVWRWGSHARDKELFVKSRDVKLLAVVMYDRIAFIESLWMRLSMSDGLERWMLNRT